MIQVHFKNMERSQLATDAVLSRMQAAIDKFPELMSQLVTVTLELNNSPAHAGPDEFTVALHVSTGRYRGVRLSKSADNLYKALAEVMEHLLERLNRYGDRARVKARSLARQQARPWQNEAPSKDTDDIVLDEYEFA